MFDGVTGKRRKGIHFNTEPKNLKRMAWIINLITLDKAT